MLQKRRPDVAIDIWWLCLIGLQLKTEFGKVQAAALVKRMPVIVPEVGPYKSSPAYFLCFMIA